MKNPQNTSVNSSFWKTAWRSFLLRATIITAALVAVSPEFSVAHAQSAKAKPHCDKVGGAFVTNFVEPDQTAGTATGDLKGALGVKVLETVSGAPGDGMPIALKVRHFWVTETGDTLFTKDAVVTAYPGTSPTQPLLYSFVYEQGIELVGGTGKFDGAKGLLKAWGAIDLEAGEVVGRYAGEICYKAPRKP
jgi:hypothetical protein